MIFFLGNKKRDLSDKSRNGEDAKRVKENAESTGSLSDLLFFQKGLSYFFLFSRNPGIVQNVFGQVFAE